MHILQYNSILFNNNLINFGQKNTINDEFIKKVIEHYHSKGEIAEFCKQNKCSTATYYKALNVAGIKKERLKINIDNTEFIEAVKSNYYNNTLPIDKFCKQNHCSKTAYSNIIKKLELPSTKEFQTQKRNELMKKAIVNYFSNKPATDFCKENNCGISSYYNYLREYGINIKTKTEKRYKPLLKAIQAHLKTKDESVQDFCKKHNCSVGTYYKILDYINKNN